MRQAGSTHLVEELQGLQSLGPVLRLNLDGASRAGTSRARAAAAARGASHALPHLDVVSAARGEHASSRALRRGSSLKLSESAHAGAFGDGETLRGRSSPWSPWRGLQDFPYVRTSPPTAEQHGQLRGVHAPMLGEPIGIQATRGVQERSTGDCGLLSARRPAQLRPGRTSSLLLSAPLLLVLVANNPGRAQDAEPNQVREILRCEWRSAEHDRSTAMHWWWCTGDLAAERWRGSPCSPAWPRAGLLHTILFNRALGHVRPQEVESDVLDVSYVSVIAAHGGVHLRRNAGLDISACRWKLAAAVGVRGRPGGA